MHNNFHFLQKLTPVLDGILRNTVVSECFSQQKDELIIRFETAGSPFYIKADLSPAFSCLCFPQEYHRARKNSIDLFSQLIGQRVLAIYQTPYDRSFTIRFHDSYFITFKMHANRSNVLVGRDHYVNDVFRKNLKADMGTDIRNLARTVDWSHASFLSHIENLSQLYFTFGKPVWRHLTNEGFFTLSPAARWERIQTLLGYLSDPVYYHCRVDGQLTFSLVPVDKIEKTFDVPMVALNDFYFNFVKQDAFGREKFQLITLLRKKIASAENFLSKTSRKLREIETDGSYKIWADLLMANLHVLSQGAEVVYLPDFYRDNKTVEIRLKKDLTPQKNAALFYTKSKKQQTEVHRLKETLKGKHYEIEKDRALLQRLEAIEDVKTLRDFAAQNKVTVTTDRDEEVLPYHLTTYDGYTILIGKNAASNDKLMQGYSYKDDLWLHAKDATGSHVLIKYQSGKNYPAAVIERAAQLAAYYSKRKTDTLCPVTVTPRKYVRKRKGDPAGAVVVEREDVILVEPRP